MAWTRSLVIVVAFASTPLASAQPKDRPVPVPPRPNLPAVVGGHEVAKFSAPAGFIDDAVAFDDKRIAYVIADGASKAELHVASIAPAAPAKSPAAPTTPTSPGGTAPTGTAPTGTAPTGTAPTGTAPTKTVPTGTAPTTAPTGTAPTGTAPTAPAGTGPASPAGAPAANGETVIDIAAVTTHPIALELVGQRAFIVGVAEDSSQVGALIELAAVSKTKPAGTVVYKLTGTHITLVKRDGKTRIAVHRESPSKTGTRHAVELDALETGKRIAAGALDVDSNNTSREQDFHVNNWADGYTRAIGMKGGAWDKKENQRTPDAEATFDVLAQKVVDKHAIEDLFEQRKRYQALADANGQVDFVKLSWDNASLQVWRAGKPKPLELDQPLSNYDPKSLHGYVTADTTWLALKVDPTNPDAVARKKADPEYFDVFRAGADNKAVRKLRVLATGARHRFGVMKDTLWMLERSQGFDRGGKTLTIYKVD